MINSGYVKYNCIKNTKLLQFCWVSKEPGTYMSAVVNLYAHKQHCSWRWKYWTNELCSVQLFPDKANSNSKVKLEPTRSSTLIPLAFPRRRVSTFHHLQEAISGLNGSDKNHLQQIAPLGRELECRGGARERLEADPYEVHLDDAPIATDCNQVIGPLSRSTKSRVAM